MPEKKEIRNLTQLDDDYLQHENETGRDKESFKKKEIRNVIRV